MKASPKLPKFPVTKELQEYWKHIGRLGGMTAAKNMTADQRKERSMKAARASAESRRRKA